VTLPVMEPRGASARASVRALAPSRHSLQATRS
jgi:hypothetical protein